MKLGVIGKLNKIARRLFRFESRETFELETRKLNAAWPDTCLDDLSLDPDLENNLAQIDKYLEFSTDACLRRFQNGNVHMALIYIDEFTDQNLLRDSVLIPLMAKLKKTEITKTKAVLAPESLIFDTLASHRIENLFTIQSILDSMLLGQSVLLAQGWTQALAIDTEGLERRSIEEPESEVAVRGPRDGFAEGIETNISLIRRRIRHPYLKIKMLTKGRLTRTRVAIVYIKGLARCDVLDEVMARLNRIDTDSVLESGVIEEFIEDSPFSPFPQMDITERPDRVASFLLEGKIAIVIDGTPFVITVPVTLAALIRHPEDYYNRWMVVSLFRLVRYFGAAVSLGLPSVYLALVSFHQELLPRSLALSIAQQREQVPYPALIEVLVMLLIFEILTEATVRLPKTLGQTIGIVGALVIGDAAVSANLISAVMVIVISLTALSQFTLPYPLTLSVRIFRLPLLVLTSVLGLFGVFSGLILLLLHASSLRSFGIPFLAPFAPVGMHELSDTVVRLPWWAKIRRATFVGDRKPQRMKEGLRPKKPKDASKLLELEKGSKLDEI